MSEEPKIRRQGKVTDHRLMEGMEPYCTHGIALSVPCLKCQEFVRQHYPEYSSQEPQTIQ